MKERGIKTKATWCPGNHSLPPTSRPVVIAPPLPSKPPSAPVVECDILWWGISQLGSLCPSQLFAQRRGKSRKKRQPWCCASTALHSPERSCVVNAVVVTKHGTSQAARKKILSILARPSTFSNVHRSTKVSFRILHLRRVPPRQENWKGKNQDTI